MHRTSILEGVERTFEVSGRVARKGLREGHDSAFALLCFFTPFGVDSVIGTTIIIPAFFWVLVFPPPPYQFVTPLTCLMSFLLCLYLLLGIIITPHVSLARWERGEGVLSSEPAIAYASYPLGALDVWGVCVPLQRVPFVREWVGRLGASCR